MTEDVSMLIRYVVQNDSVRAKKQAEIILNKNTTAKDKNFCESMLRQLHNTPNMLELPANIASLARMEDVSLTFNEARYHLSEEEKTLCTAIQTADNVNARLTELGIRYLNSTLLYGESGTGKTTFGKYLAYKMGIPFLYLNFADCIDSYLGKTGSNLQRVFEYAKTQRCVFMIDEIDAIGGKRGLQGELGEMNRILISLLQLFDSLQNDTILLAATNRFDILDEALVRRFARKHKVKCLDRSDVFLFAKSYFESVGLTLEDEEIKSFAETASCKQSELANQVIEYIIAKIQGDVTLEQGK